MSTATVRMLRKLSAVVALLIAGSGCNSASSVHDAIDIAQGVPRKTIDASHLGVNSFFNDPRFGSIAAQAQEIKGTLRLNFVRVLFHWNDGIQAGPSAPVNLSFYDNIVGSIPDGMDALVVITGLPSWMKNSANWSGGNPRLTFVERYVRTIVQRYAANPHIVGWQIWNEPNDPANPDNVTMDFIDRPANYVEMLAAANNEAKNAAPGKLVLNAATTAINQNFSDTLDYNRGMRDAGAVSFVDVWAIHYYGKQFENVIRSGGVADFLNGLGRTIWVTESGDQGVSQQLAYGEQVWPFLKDQIGSVDRIYQYQFAEATPAESTYGLRNLTPGMELSDLYVWLRDR